MLGPRVLLFAMLVATGFAAYAERADREKPINVEADRMTADDLKKVAVFEGRVVLTQGTTVLRADRIVVRQDKDGLQAATATGKPATFRTKRDGVDEWIDGESQRIEYDQRQERVELFDRARLVRDKDEVRGDYISYETKTEVFQVQPTKVAGANNDGRSGGRVSATFQPKPKPAPPSSSAPLELRTEPALSTTRPDSR